MTRSRVIPTLPFLQKMMAQGAVLSLCAGIPLAAVEGFTTGQDPVEIDWVSGDGFVLSSPDGSVRLFPSINLAGVVGDSTADDITSLQGGEHDPDDTGLDLQFLEFSGTLLIGDFLSGTAIYALHLEDDDSFEGEFEEVYAAIHDQAKNNGIRAGRFLNHFGSLNSVHQHERSFVDTPIVLNRFLGEGGLRTEGAEVLLGVQNPRSGLAFAFAVGQAAAHDHDHDDDHDHGHDDDHDHGHDGDHDDDHDHGHDGDHDHDHHHGGDHFEEDAFLFEDTFASARLLGRWHYNDFHHWSPFIGIAAGENEAGKTNYILNIGTEYNWSENGFEPGGRSLTWRTDFYWRTLKARDHGEDHDHEDEDDHDHGGNGGDSIDTSEFGFFTEAIYRPNQKLDLGGRLDYVSGSSEADLDERWRISPAATYYLTKQRNAHLRAQYNFDILPDDEEHSVWIQLSFSWGAHIH